jgi:hypothetical protein
MFSRMQPIANSNSNGNPRKRQKRAHAHSSDSEDGPSHQQPHPPPAMPFAPSLPHAVTGAEQQTCRHEQLLKRLEPDIDSMRQLITCKICQRFLSEPYGLACGHTYCYVCLDAWLVAQRKRTCPDCRATIKQQPIPSYLIREMTRVFVNRAELLPDGETVEEHEEYIQEAATQVATDKGGRGLFSGMFKHGERAQWMPIHDPGDEVDRCPNCHWELEEGVCGSCGLHVGEDVDGFGLDTGEEESSDDDELDNDMVPHDFDGIEDPGSFDEDDFMNEEDVHEEIDLDAFGAYPMPPAHLRRHRPDQINLDSEPESEDSEDPDNDPQMVGFLDNEEPEESDSDSSRVQSDSEPEAEETPRNARPRHIIRHMVIDDSDDDVPQQPRRPVVIDSSDDEEEGPVARNNQRVGKVSRGTRRPVVQEISSSEDTSEDDNGNGNVPHGNDVNDDVDSESESNSESDNGGVNAGNFSPLQSIASSEDEAAGAEDNYGAYGIGAYDYDEGDDSNEDDPDDFPDFAAEGDRNTEDGYGVYYDADSIGGDGPDADDDGGRSTTAGSAHFPSLFKT